MDETARLQDSLISFEGEGRIPASVLTACMASPWMIQEESLKTILAVVNRVTDPEAVAAKLGRPLQNTRAVEIRGDAAIIPVSGPIFRYANLFTAISGATSIEQLALDFNTAIENPSVNRIILSIDSPGGQVTGISEFAQIVFEAREKKQIQAYVGGMAASAAYWIASAAEDIFISDTAILGSIGTVISIQDRKKADEKSGVKTFELVSRKSPKKRLDLETEEGKNEILSMLDAMTEIFIQGVSINRAYSIEKVENEFGQGGIFVGEENVKRGLADAVRSFEEVISNSTLNSKETKEEKNMLEKQDLKIEMTAEKMTAEYPQIVADISFKAAEAERNRIKGIESNSMPGYENIISEMKWDGKTSPAEAAMRILTEEKKRIADLGIKREADAKAVEKISPEGEAAAAEAKANEDAELVRNMANGISSKNNDRK